METPEVAAPNPEEQKQSTENKKENEDELL